MKRIFVIGGMGAGKSSVSALLAAASLPVIDLDRLGHKALEGAEARESLASAFGQDILDAQGMVDRRALATKAFSCAESTTLLNSLQLPRIKALLEAELAKLEQSGSAYAAIEYSAYAPGPNEPFVGSEDIILAVVAPEDIRMQRLMQAGWSEADARARIARQITDEERIAHADAVVRNDSNEAALRKQVQAFLETLPELAAGASGEDR